MRQARLKVPPARGTAYYHCVSRVVDRQFLFGPPEKEQFLKFMREYEAFCGVRILTFCLLSNHFHLLVAVPPPHIGGMYWIFVTLKTDCGIEGVGEIYAATFHPKAMVPIIASGPTSVAPTASRIRNDAAPKAVLATRHSLHLRKARGVKRSA